jgi:hypothetical protein
MASLGQIAALGGPEKAAAREYAASATKLGVRLAIPVADLVNSRERMAFLQGILWERERARLDAIAQRLLDKFGPGGPSHVPDEEGR